MAQNFLQIRNGVTFGNQSSTPTSPVNGDIYYDSTRNTHVRYSNGQWADLQSRTDVATSATLTSANFPAATMQSSLVRLTGTTTGTISGFTAMPDAKQTILYNESTVAVTLLFQSGTEATAANRIVTPSGGNLNINPGYSVNLAYDSNQARWVVVSTPAAATSPNTGDDLDSLNFNVSFTDTFPDLPTSTVTSIDNSAGHTNATYNSTNQYYTLSYDASKTLTGTGTAMTLSATPSFTVAVGDIVRFGTQARRITVVSSQTSYTIESAFATNPATSACCVSQAVYTKDLNNFASDGVAPSSIYTDSVNSFILIYNDTASGTLYNFTDPALIAYSASADGTNYSANAVREANPSIEAFANSTPTSGSNLLLRFFSDATSGSGTYNLVGYKVFFHSQTAVEAGGVINQAYAFTNGVGTPYNCTISGSGAPTQANLSWSYPMGLNVGGPDGSLSVYLNGQKIPRFINSTLTPDASYLEVSGNAIQLDRDYSSQNLNLEITQSSNVVDSNTQNTTNIASLQQVAITPPVIRTLTTGSGTFNLDYNFYTASCSATAGATYTNNGVTFTVYQTVSNASQIVLSGSNVPTIFGVLTKTGGTGDTTITFSSVKAPSWIRVRAVGGGGGGAGAGNTGTAGSGNAITASTASTFGSSLISAGGGGGGVQGSTSGNGAGGACTINSPAIQILALTGGTGGGQQSNNSGTNISEKGGDGAPSAFGGGGGGGGSDSGAQANGVAGVTNTGGGGGGGTCSSNGAVHVTSGSGGGAGGYAEALIYSPSVTYAYAVGVAGSGGGAATNGTAGGAGGSGIIIVEEHYVGG